MDKKDNLQYTLRLWMLICIIIVYIMSMMVGACLLIYILCFYNFDVQIMLHTVIASLSSALCMCGMQYTKRIYKACIYKRIHIVTETNRIDCIGNFVYFLARPLFAVAFVMIFIFGIKAGIIVIMDTTGFVENDRFLYVCTIVSAMIGFSVGKVLDVFQDISWKGIEKMRGENND